MQQYSEKQLDEMQMSLGVAGMTPGPVGSGFDLTNFGISLDRGNYGWAGVDFLSALPGLGIPVAAAAAFFGRGKKAAGSLEDITRTSAGTLGGGVVGGGFGRSRGAAYSPFGTIAKRAELDYRPELVRQFAKDNNMSYQEAVRLFENLGISPPRAFDAKVGQQSPQALYSSDIARLPFEERQRELRNLSRQTRTQDAGEIGEKYFSDAHVPSKLERSLIGKDGQAISIVQGYHAGKYGQPVPNLNYDTISDMASEASMRTSEAIELPVLRYEIDDPAQFSALVKFSGEPAGSVFATSQPRLKNKLTSETHYTKYADVEVPHIDVEVPEHARYQSAEFMAEDYGLTREGQRYAAGELDEAGNLPFEASMPTMSPGEAAQFESLTSAGVEGGRLVDPASARGAEGAIEATDESRQFEELGSSFDNQMSEIENLSNDGGRIVDEFGEVAVESSEFNPGRINELAEETGLPQGVSKYVGPSGVNLQGKSLRGYGYDQLNGLDANKKLALGLEEMTPESFDKLDDGAIVKLLMDANLPIAPGGFVPSIAPDVMLNENVIAQVMKRVSDPQQEGNIRPLISAKDNMVTAYSELPYKHRMAADELAGLEDPALYKRIESSPGDIVTFNLAKTNESVSFEVFDIYSKGEGFALRLKNTPYTPQQKKSLLKLANKSPELLVSYARSIGVPELSDDLVNALQMPNAGWRIKDNLIEKIIKHERLSATGKSLKGVRNAWQNTEETLTGAANNWGGLVKIHHHAAPGDRYPAQLLMGLDVIDPKTGARSPLTQVHRLPAYSHLKEPEHQMALLNQLTTRELIAAESNIKQSWSSPRAWQYKGEFNSISRKAYDVMFGRKISPALEGAPMEHLVRGSVPPALAALLQQRRLMHMGLGDNLFGSLLHHEKDEIIKAVLELPSVKSPDYQIKQIRNRVLSPMGRRLKIDERRIDSMAHELAKLKSKAEEISTADIKSGGFYSERIGQPGGHGTEELAGALSPSTSSWNVAVAEPDGYLGTKALSVSPAGLKINPSETVSIAGHRAKDLDLPSGNLEGGLPARGVYEVSSEGDKRFSALTARLKDGRTIEQAYQVDVKGYPSIKAGKGKPPKNRDLNLDEEYLNLWRQWSDENPELIKELASSSDGKKLNDKFAKRGTVSQADALETILAERGLRAQPSDVTVPTYRGEGTYGRRTFINAGETDATLAIAVNFHTKGEQLTMKAAAKKHIKVDLDPSRMDVSSENVDFVVDRLNELKATSLNIAGNGIYTLKPKGISQEAIDTHVKELIEAVNNHPRLKKKITKIQSGGQTGVDEAGIKAGQSLGVKTNIVGTSDWKFRTADGTDVSDKGKFLERFGVKLDETPYSGPSVPRLEPDDPKVNAIKEALKGSIREKAEAGKTTFISGMDEGIGIWAAEEVLALKKEFPNIRLIAALAFKGQDEIMSAANQKRYQSILKQADGVIEKGWKPAKKTGEDFDHAFNSRSQLMQGLSGESIVVHDGRRFGRTHQYMQDIPSRLHQERYTTIDPKKLYNPPAGTEDVDLLAGLSDELKRRTEVSRAISEQANPIAKAAVGSMARPVNVSSKSDEVFGTGFMAALKRKLGKKKLTKEDGLKELEKMRAEMEQRRLKTLEGWNPEWGKSDLE